MAERDLTGIPVAKLGASWAKSLPSQPCICGDASCGMPLTHLSRSWASVASGPCQRCGTLKPENAYCDVCHPKGPSGAMGCAHWDWDFPRAQCRGCGFTQEALYNLGHAIPGLGSRTLGNFGAPGVITVDGKPTDAVSLTTILREQEATERARVNAEQLAREARERQWMDAWERAWVDYRAQDEAPAPPKKREIDPRPVYGFRAFRATPDGWLGSVAHGGEWYVGENEAFCAAKSDHDGPERGCGCGFYAFHTAEFRAQYGVAVGQIKAVVIGYGRTIVHDEGWRCQYARIVALVGDRRKLRPYAKRYGVPVIRAGDAEMLAREHGRSGAPERYPVVSKLPDVPGVGGQVHAILSAASVDGVVTGDPQPLPPGVADTLYDASPEDVELAMRPRPDQGGADSWAAILAQMKAAVQPTLTAIRADISARMTVAMTPPSRTIIAGATCPACRAKGPHLDPGKLVGEVQCGACGYKWVEVARVGAVADSPFTYKLDPSDLLKGTSFT